MRMVGHKEESLTYGRTWSRTQVIYIYIYSIYISFKSTFMLLGPLGVGFCSKRPQ